LWAQILIGGACVTTPELEPGQSPEGFELLNTALMSDLAIPISDSQHPARILLALHTTVCQPTPKPTPKQTPKPTPIKKEKRGDAWIPIEDLHVKRLKRMYANENNAFIAEKWESHWDETCRLYPLDAVPMPYGGRGSKKIRDHVNMEKRDAETRKQGMIPNRKRRPPTKYTRTTPKCHTCGFDIGGTLQRHICSAAAQLVHKGIIVLQEGVDVHTDEGRDAVTQLAAAKGIKTQIDVINALEATKQDKVNLKVELKLKECAQAEAMMAAAAWLAS
tara:strand:- start:4335 stop:5162 length:828 start_codon:yes stop_codon:yes gene_type:complete